MKIMDGLKAAWKDPVWSKVIATGLVAGIVAITGYLLSLWPLVRNWMTECWSSAIATTVVPNWLLMLLVICAGLFVANLAGRLPVKFRARVDVATRPALSPVEAGILYILAKSNEDYVSLRHLSLRLKANKVAVEHAVDELDKVKLLEKAYFSDGPVCSLTESGRAHVVAKGYTN